MSAPMRGRFTDLPRPTRPHAALSVSELLPHGPRKSPSITTTVLLHTARPTPQSSPLSSSLQASPTALGRVLRTQLCPGASGTHQGSLYTRKEVGAPAPQPSLPAPPSHPSLPRTTLLAPLALPTSQPGLEAPGTHPASTVAESMRERSCRPQRRAALGPSDPSLQPSLARRSPCRTTAVPRDAPGFSQALGWTP